MVAALVLGTMAGVVLEAEILYWAEEQKERNESGRMRHQKAGWMASDSDSSVMRNWGTDGSYCNGNGTASGR